MRSAISQPVLVGFNGSVSCINRHTPESACTLGFQAHRQWVAITRQSGQRSAREPRAMNGLMLRASRSARRRATAWLMLASLGTGCDWTLR
ncbi:hypothetical protein D3C79_741770 [compost metagenome]